MKPLAEAQAAVLDRVRALPPGKVRLGDSLGLVLAEAAVAPHPVPPFTNSAMDGYAVRAVDTSGAPIELDISEAVPAGHVASGEVSPATAIKIMTGAPLPAGADAVVRVEDAEELEGAGRRAVRILHPVVAGTNVRPVGGDVAGGATVFPAGTRLGPAHLGVLASLGIAAPVVRRRPRVAVFSTGDEVQPPETVKLRPGWIRDANRPLLVGLLADLGVETADYGIVPDDAGRLRSTLQRAAGDCDAIISSGGVSMGEYDLVKQVLSQVGDVELWRVAMQPAKPFAFGEIDGVPLFGLPGNPVSVLVAFEQFARPALLTMMGAEFVFRPQMPGVMKVGVSTDPAKVVFLRVQVSLEGDRLIAHPAGAQASNVLSAAATADAFAVVPVGTEHVGAGGKVTLEMFRWPASRSRGEVLG